MTYSKQEIT